MGEYCGDVGEYVGLVGEQVGDALLPPWPSRYSVLGEGQLSSNVLLSFRFAYIVLELNADKILRCFAMILTAFTPTSCTLVVSHCFHATNYASGKSYLLSSLWLLKTIDGEKDRGGNTSNVLVIDFLLISKIKSDSAALNCNYL